MASFVSEFLEGARVGIPMAGLVFGAFTLYALLLSLFFPEVSLFEAFRVALVGDVAAAVLGSLLTVSVSLWASD